MYQCLFLFSPLNLTLKAYADVGLADNIFDRKSQFFFFLLWDSLISWKSNNLSLLTLPLKLNTMLLRLLHLKEYGPSGFYPIWVFLLHFSPLFIVITKVLSRLRTIQFFMSVWSTSRMIVILFADIFNQAQLICHLFHPCCSCLISSPRLTLLLDVVFYLTNSWC